MNNDPSQTIPVGPILFARGLPRFAASLARGKPNIVAIGSSSTAGEGHIAPYPDRLIPLLQVPYPNAKITVFNEGIGGQEAPIELARFDDDVIAKKPDLVIWQVGTNAVWQRPDSNPPPPTFEETTTAIRDGLVRLRNETEADVILMDPQYLPAMLTPAKKDKTSEMVQAIDKLVAETTDVNLFRRFAFMQALHDIEGVSFDRMVDPGDQDRLHQSDWVTGRVARALTDAIVEAVERTWKQAAASSSSS